MPLAARAVGDAERPEIGDEQVSPGAGAESCFWLGEHRSHRRRIGRRSSARTLRDGLLGCVDEDEHAAIQPPDVDEAEVGCGVDALEEVLALADRDRGRKRWKPSISPCSIRVASSGPFPYLERFWPASRLRSSTNDASPPSVT
jgi:hypothetical protein